MDLKEDNMEKMVHKIHAARMKISELCNGSIGKIGTPRTGPTTLAAQRQPCKEVSLHAAAKEKYWEERVREGIPEGLKEELKELEAAIREDLL